MKKVNIKDKVRGRKSYFYKFLLNFMLTLCVPILAILIIFQQAEHTVRNQIQVSNQSTLNQFFRMVDTVAKEMEDVCVSVVSNVECENYAYYAIQNSAKAPYQTLVVKNMLNNYARDIFYDVFAYFPEDDRIISGVKASLRSDYYYDTYYKTGKSEELWEDFSTLLECSFRGPTFFR